MDQITFATLATPASAAKTILFVESLRAFGGAFTSSPVIVLTPAHTGALPEDAVSKLDALGAQRITFEMREAVQGFPLAAVPYAAAAAEAQVKGNSELLVWMLLDALILNPPAPFDLPAGIDFAYRPVHHTLVGSIYDQPPDAFWSAVYRHCEADEASLFPMQTCVRDNILRPYFNAGLAVVRPVLELLTTWAETFDRLVHHPDFETLYQENKLYAVFMHQAILSAVVPKLLARERMMELPETINYPLHLHTEHPPENRPARLNDLITCRYEEFEILQGVLDAIPVDEPLKSWLTEQLQVGQSRPT